MKLSCGCSEDGAERCAEHIKWHCHNPHAYVGTADWPDLCSECELVGSIAHTDDEYPCPPCRLAKWRSVSLSSDATPTRKR